MKEPEKTFESRDPPARLGELSASVARAILGKQEEIRLVITALLARGHLLIEDIPGVGKTTMAQALARSIGSPFRRIQFTSDLLPSDILGVKVYEPATGEFRFMPGPIFNSIILADEINRTTPRTQSALLEAMNETQVTIEGETHPLPLPFMVIATENPLEHHGTYPLPDSQLDRFLMSIAVGYPPGDEERRILAGENADPLQKEFSTVMSGQEVVHWQERTDSVKMAPEIIDYILAIINATRVHHGLRLGASPRAALALRQAAKAYALMQGRDYCLPDDVKTLAVPVLAHRLIPKGPSSPEEKRRLGREAVEEVLDQTAVPL